MQLIERAIQRFDGVIHGDQIDWKRFLQPEDKTRIIPGTGAVVTRAELQTQYEMLSTMKDRLIGLMKKGMGTDDILATPPTSEFDGTWGDPKLFLVNAYKGLWGHVRELGGIV